MRIEIPGAVEKIIRRLNDCGYEAYAVGGCVRDSILGLAPKDWDITTSAKPDRVKELFPRTIDTGILHGTVTVMMDRQGYEVTTFRVDGEYRDGRHPSSVEFTPDLPEDLKRRDFTINAMAYSHETGVVDIFGGMDDLRRGLIRCVGNPTERFKEDALRILRAIRFCAQLDFAIDPGTWEAVRLLAPDIGNVSKERIQDELTKLLVCSHPEKVNLVFQAGLSPYISEHFCSISPENVSVSAKLEASKTLRWASLLKCVTEGEATVILRELKMDNHTISRVRTLTRWWRAPIKADKTAVRRVMSRMDDDTFDELIQLKLSVGGGEQIAADIEDVRKLASQIRMSGDCVRLKDLAINGDDLIRAGMDPGKGIGELLNNLLEDVLAHPEHNTYGFLMREATVEKSPL